MSVTERKGFIEVAQESGSIILPRWFIWLMSGVSTLAVPLAIGAVAWAWSVNSTLTEMSVNIKHMREGGGELEVKVEALDKEIEAHMRDPTIHRYELDRLRGEMQRLTDRVERLEGGN